VRAKNSWHIHGRGSMFGVWGLLPLAFYQSYLLNQQLTWRSLKCQMFSGTIHPSVRSSVPTYVWWCTHPVKLLMEIAVSGGVWRRLPVVLGLEKFMLKGCQFDLGTNCACHPRRAFVWRRSQQKMNAIHSYSGAICLYNEQSRPILSVRPYLRPLSVVRECVRRLEKHFV